MEMEEIYARKVSGTYPYNLLESIFGREAENTEHALFFHKQLLERMKDGVKQLSVQFDDISADACDFKLQLKKAADALMRLSDRVQFEIKSLDIRSDE